jgi:putative membrane protein
MDAPNNMEVLINIKYIVNALVFSILGIVILIFSFFVFDKMTPGNLWKEVVEEKNIALAITAGAMALAIAQIIASAIHS